MAEFAEALETWLDKPSKPFRYAHHTNRDSANKLISFVLTAAAAAALLLLGTSS